MRPDSGTGAAIGHHSLAPTKKLLFPLSCFAFYQIKNAFCLCKKWHFIVNASVGK